MRIKSKKAAIQELPFQKRQSQSFQKTAFQRRAMATAVASALLGSGGMATAQSGSSADAMMEEVVVYGIRGSLSRSMDQKRDAQGVLEAITAEDIGKMPDTNLAESLQRLTGVSIDRANGEGSRVTVRGFGPDYNVVTLNGRHMPAANVEDTSASASRSFDFAQVAAEVVSGVQVYKTGRADLPTGGIGSVLNVQTIRPLGISDRIISVGAKMLNDSTNKDGGSDYTPEISGIYADTFADDTFGLAVAVSYAERDSGFAQGGVTSGWINCATGAAGNCPGNWGGIAPDAAGYTNPPQVGTVYAIPQNVNYAFGQVQRERTNALLTLQWQPREDVTATLDYVFSEYEVEEQRHEMNAWFNRAHRAGTMLTESCQGCVVAPLVYVDASGSDFSMAVGNWGRVNETSSIALNVEWTPMDNLTLAFDYHTAEAENGAADDRRGSNNTVNAVQFNRSSNTADFRGELPSVDVTLNPALDPGKMLSSGSSFRNSYMKHEIEQAQVDGVFEFDDVPFGVESIDFGISRTVSTNRSAYSFSQRDTWGGYSRVIITADAARAAARAADETAMAASLGRDLTDDEKTAISNAVTARIARDDTDPMDEYRDEAFTARSLTGEFDDLSWSGTLEPLYYRADFDMLLADIAGVAAWARSNGHAAAGDLGPCDTVLCAGSIDADPARTDRTVEETQLALYAQANFAWEDGRMPMSLSVGLRYEDTDVDSDGWVPNYTGIDWVGANEFRAIADPNGSTYLNDKGGYDYWLPNIDFDIEVVENVVLRASYSMTLTRPGFADLRGGTTISSDVRLGGGTGNTGNPNLKPFESTNFDLSGEWYYDEGSYVSLGYYRKDVDNFIGQGVSVETPFPNLTHPGRGSRHDAAVAAVMRAGGDVDDQAAVRAQFISQNPDVTNADGTVTKGTVGNAQDDVAPFSLGTPTNVENAEIDGWELAWQHMFADTGFGLILNYTTVDGDVGYDNFNINDGSTPSQFALLGLSDSANLVAFYDKHGIQARLAYNWRDDFLSSTTAAGTDGRTNPAYTEAYSQWDISVSYDFPQVEGLSIVFEGINVTNETRRLHGRHENMVIAAIEQGARYTLGVRYQFNQ